MRSCILLLLLVPGIAGAGQLHRCLASTGQVSYQSDSCPAGSRTTRIVRFVPDASSGSPGAARTAGHRPAQVDSRGTGPTTPRLASRRPGTAMTSRAACVQAKAQRERQLARLGLKRTYDDLSRIDAEVRAVCNGY